MSGDASSTRRGRVVRAVKLLGIYISIWWLTSSAVVEAPVGDDDNTKANPSLMPGQRVVISRIHYKMYTPARGDIVVVPWKATPSLLAFRRIVGLPGEHVRVENGRVFCNGVPLTEDYARGVEDAAPGILYEGVLGAYLLMDEDRSKSLFNPETSMDQVSENEIAGRVFFVYSFWRCAGATTCFGFFPRPRYNMDMGGQPIYDAASPGIRSFFKL